MLRKSRIKEINTHTDSDDFKNIKWLLVMDEYRFHVFVVAAIRQDLYIRIDWNDNSTLTFIKYVPISTETRTLVGFKNFCKLCIDEEMEGYLKQYDLFRFNCRTVSFLVLLVVGFEKDYIYSLFKTAGVLCGLNEKQCLSDTEINRFIEWLKGKNGYLCTIS